MWKILNKNKQQDKKTTREPSQRSNSVEEKNNHSSIVGSFRKEENRPSAIKSVIQNVRKSDSFVGNMNKWTIKERDNIGLIKSTSQQSHFSQQGIPDVTVDAGIERQISAAARRLGDEIQHVVFAAKQGNQAKRKNVREGNDNDEWKAHLLQILGGSDNDVKELQLEHNQTRDGDSRCRNDIDTLLAYSNVDKFVLRCLENELPPNLIHCMRLLRVLELQMAHSTVSVQDNQEIKGSEATDSEDNRINHVASVTPSSMEATKKVEQLLCRLCSDPSVGEQLRPHLFGLLALSGAIYPPNAVHVACAASNIIVAIAKECLSHNLAYFLHDRKMIIHMTDDVKELCGMSVASTGTLASFCLYGQAAEKYGLWFFALKAIVQLIRESCRKNCYELLKDFYSAGGYHVLSYAISNSDTLYMKKILELAVLMVSCQTEEAAELLLDDMSIATNSTSNSTIDDQFASNPAAYEIIENLMYESVPLLIDLLNKNNGEHLIIEIGGNLTELAKISIELSLKFLQHKPENVSQRENSKDLLSCEILLSTMHLYSDHPLNYTIIEEKYQILSLFLLSYPTFTNKELKKLCLRTLEYSCTGLSEADCSIALYVMAEVFFCLCKTLFRLAVDKDQIKDYSPAIDAFSTDALTLGASLEKLLEVEDSLGEILISCGILGDLMDEYLALIMTIPSRQDRIRSDHIERFLVRTNQIVDEVYCSICRILDIIIKSSVTVAAVTSPQSDRSNSPLKHNIIEKRRDDLNLFLTIGITDLGVNSSTSALLVFESKLSYGDDTALKHDMECIFKLFDQLLTTKQVIGSDEVSIALKNQKYLNLDNIMITIDVLKMLKRVLVDSKSAQEVFRSKGGFESLVRLLASLECDETIKFDEKEDHIKIFLQVVEIIFKVLNAASTPTKRESKNFLLVTSTKSPDLLIKENNTFKSPALSNRTYMRDIGLYETLVSALGTLPLFRTLETAQSVLELCFWVFDPLLQVSKSGYQRDAHSISSEGIEISKDLRLLHNPDAIRLVLGVIVQLPLQESFLYIAKECLSILLKLCSPDRAGTTLNQISNTGLTVLLTSNDAYAKIFEDVDHPLHSQFVVLLRRIASFKLSYIDFVSILRGIAGPIVKNDNDSNIILPIICSAAGPKDSDCIDCDLKENDEEKLLLRLQTLVAIAEMGDRVPRCQLGGGTIPFSYNQDNSNCQDSIYVEARQGSIRFIEIRKVDATSEFLPSGNNSVSTNNSVEKLWSPAATTGFSFSLWLRLMDPDAMPHGNVFVFDISSPSMNKSDTLDFISIWYDSISKAFNVITSNWLKPISFPASPLQAGVWHHILLTFQPPKLANVLSRKTILGLCVDGRPLEVDLKIDAVPLTPQSNLRVGVPNQYLAYLGIVDGFLPDWDAGSLLLVSTILGPRDAMSIFAAGPDFRSQFWGDRPQRLSLAATATTVFSMLSECGERCSVSAALKRRDLSEIENVSHVTRNSFTHNNQNNDNSLLLSAAGLFCQLAPEYIVCALHPSSSLISMSEGPTCNPQQQDISLLLNVAKVNANSCVSTDAIVHGSGCIVSPTCFADNVQWVGGPNILLPIVNAAKTSSTLALALRVIQESTHRHVPNLEMLQSGGGYRILAFLLHQKHIVNEIILDHCFAFAIHGYVPSISEATSKISPDQWVLVDPDAMKYLILNHQVWNLQSSGPTFSLHLLSMLNGLVFPTTMHNVFNARRLHLLGIVKWTLQLMLEITELYTNGIIGKTWSEFKEDDSKLSCDSLGVVMGAFKNGWHNLNKLSISSTSVGGDPGIPLLQSCKHLLRNVLARMQTPEDLSDIADAVVYTLSLDILHDDIISELGLESNHDAYLKGDDDSNLRISSATRIYLIRLLEELIVDGIHQISSTSGHIKFGNRQDDNLAQFANPGNTEKKTLMNRIRNQSNEDIEKQREQNLQYFLSIFASVLTPEWFACVLQGCQDEASASAVFRLLIIMLQSSKSFKNAFEEAGSFTPLVLSIPKYSTSPSIIMSMLSQLLHAPIHHLPSFGSLDGEQLCSIFDHESDVAELILHARHSDGLRKLNDPSSGIFALLAECLGRNIQLGAIDNDIGLRARQTNEAVLCLLIHRHIFSSQFQDFCETPDFLEPLAQSLCLVHGEKIVNMESNNDVHDECFDSMYDHKQKPQDYEKSSHLSRAMSQSRIDINDSDNVLVDWPSSQLEDSLLTDGNQSNKDMTRLALNSSSRRKPRRHSLQFANLEDSPVVRFVGEGGDSTGVGLVRLLHHVIAHAVKSSPRALTLVDALFKSFPIHASTTEVDAFHLVLTDQCRSIVEETIQRGNSGSLISFANCVGISSVLLDLLCDGFFSSESILATTNTILSTLRHISDQKSYAFRLISKEDPKNIIRTDAAHIARLTTLVALKRSKPNPGDYGDEILQGKLLIGIKSSLDDMLNESTAIPPLVSESDPMRIIWESNNLLRCSPSITKYAEFYSMEDPIKAYITGLMTDLKSLLLASDKVARSDATAVIISLLKARSRIMSSLLCQIISNPGSPSRTVDLFHGGGFGALQHQNRYGGDTDEALESLRVKTFFDWIDVNKADINDIFERISKQAADTLPSIYIKRIASPEEAIELKQKEMLLTLTSKETSNKTILATFDSAQVAQRGHNKTSESQLLWKRQGLDDLSSGAMKWKAVLRQLKGSCSLWEGDIFQLTSQEALVDSKSDLIAHKCRELVSHWKLDVSEGYERQRRKLLPNYEFNKLYHVSDKSIENGVVSSDDMNELNASIHPLLRQSGGFDLNQDSVQATAELLAKMKFTKTDNQYEDEYNDNYDEFDIEFDDGLKPDYTDPTELANPTKCIDPVKQTENNDNVHQSDAEKVKNGETINDGDDDKRMESEGEEKIDSHDNNYSLITGLLNTGDIPEKSYNVKRCTGLEMYSALLIRCRHAIYVIDGFEQTDEDGLKGNINRVEKTTSTYRVNLRPAGFTSDNGETIEKNADNKHRNRNNLLESTKKKEDKLMTMAYSLYQHRCKRIALRDIYIFYRRRYQLKQLALEIYDVHNNGTFIAFGNRSESEEVLQSLLNSRLPNSILNSVAGSTTNYDKFIKSLRLKITNLWVQGKMSNFDFLMHLNSFAGRSYNDLTQYPVFPWVLADYESEEIDLTDPKVYRDLSKPMGALGPTRARQFKERYESLESHFLKKDDPPPFHYGTHYSCAAYVVNYLLRIEPFSRLALSLQGGKFDLPDRLFSDIAASWKSASHDNIQDVRELIPEFYYLADFLVNNNSFDFGTKQDGSNVHHVNLPPWAKGDPQRFVRINRQALESPHVSRNLHKWVDLIFGYKQRGREAVASLNTFVHVTYEGAVDIDSIKDPIQRDSIIAQIQNFGQTPSKLERKPFPARNPLVTSKLDRSIDFNALPYIEPLTPPLCVVGAPHKLFLRVVMQETCKHGLFGQSDSSCGDICVARGQLIGVGKKCALNIPTKRYYCFGGSNNGVSVHVSVPSAKALEINRVVTIHDDMHRAPISTVKASRNGQWLVTGCTDSTVRVWKHEKEILELQGTLCGHIGEISCLDISTTFGTIVTGGTDGMVLVWNLSTLSFLRCLDHTGHDYFPRPSPAARKIKSVSLNDKTGDIVTLIGSEITIFDINGNLVARKSSDEKFSDSSIPSCAISTDCPEWMDNGIVAVSGHKNGDIRLWGANRDEKLLMCRYVMNKNVHFCPITCLRLEGKRQGTLLAGDASGKMSMSKSLQLDSLSQLDFVKFMES